MREYSNIISLNKNSRGVYTLDTSIGCKSGMENNKGGCYGDCYAAKSSKLYGYDFSKTVLRHFENEYHRREIVRQINNIKLDFVRIGNSGDPSENWNHTISILKGIQNINKQIVIITKHWTNLTNEQLQFLSTINICVNTSISALDNKDLRDNSLSQYERLRPYCKSLLRVVSCDFNLNNELGHEYYKIQLELFKNRPVIDTVLRVNKNNKLAKDGIINIKESKFLGKKAYISKYNKKAYIGKCSTCKEMCGVNMNDSSFGFILKKPIIKQLDLLKGV
jgi:hypothetical protein